MKKIVLFALGALSLTGCKDSAELYNYHDNKIGFLFKDEESKTFVKSFVYDNSSVTRDTVYLPMRTMGFVTAEDRPIHIEQVAVSTEEDPNVINAVPGVHYISFSDPDWQKMAVVKSGEAEVLLPIILLRDKSLEKNQISLKVRIVENEVFKVINPMLGERLVLFSDQLLKPVAWNNTFVEHFGVWGSVKHRFMLDNTRERWDDDFITELIMNDSSYLLYLRKFMGTKLAQENKRRELAGEGPLREHGFGGLEGPLVTFPY